MKSSKYLLKSRMATLALAAFAALTFHAAFAGNEAVKGASQLTRPVGTSAAMPAASRTEAAMPCPKCKDEVVNRVSTEKGHIKTTAAGVKHLCPACEQKLVTSGVGKAARNVVKHTCGYSTNGDASCCVAQSTAKAVK
jgi:hypothetical protein